MQPPAALVNSPPTPLPLDAAAFDPPPGAATPRPGPGQLAGLPHAPQPNASGAADRTVLVAGLGLIRAARADLASTDPAVSGAAHTRLLMTVFHLIGYLDGLGVTLGRAGSGVAGLFSKIGQPSLDDCLDELEDTLASAILRPDTRSWQSALDGLGNTMISVGTVLLTIGLSQPVV